MSDVLPSGWAETNVGRVTSEIGYGFTAKALSLPVGPRILRITDIQGGSVQWESVPYCKIPKGKIDKYRLHPGDIVFARTGATTGKSYLIHSCPDAVFASYLIRLRPADFILPQFMAHYFQSANYWRQISENTSGSAQPNCNATKLASVALPLAPLSEQHRIVAKLEELLAKVEACQKRLDQIPLLLKRFRRAVLKAACEGSLTEDWRNDGSGVDDLPPSWAIHPLGDLAVLITKGASPNWQGVRYTSQGVLFVTSENVGSGQMIWDNKKYVEPKIGTIQPRSSLQRGDILTNIVGASIGRAAIYDLTETANINQAVALVRLNTKVDRRFILLALNSPSLVAHMNEEKVDVARANLSLKDVSAFPIPLPPLAEQEEIVRRVHVLLDCLSGLEARYAEAKQHVASLSQSVLAKAFRGDLVPQDPNDEPASKMLARMVASRNDPHGQLSRRGLAPHAPKETSRRRNLK